MVPFTESFEKIERDFIEHGISIEKPGFYDDPAFIDIEKTNPGILDNYSRYVHERPRSIEYDLHSRKVIPIIAREFYLQLKRNGRLGACIDISALISRALEREGIWNAIIKGALTINYPLLSQIPPSYYWPVDHGQFAAGHAWVMAPPFFVIDVAVQLQPYIQSKVQYLPEMICDEATRLTRGTIEDLISPGIRREFSLLGIPRHQHLQYANPKGSAYLSSFPARLLSYKGTTLKYIFFGTTAPDTPFEDMRSIEFEGKSGFEIYKELISPALGYP